MAIIPDPAPYLLSFSPTPHHSPNTLPHPLSSSDEEYDIDISKSFKDVTKTDGTTEKKATNGRGRRCAMLLNKKTVKTRIQLFTPFSSFSSLIPNNVPIGLKVYLTTSRTLIWFFFYLSIYLSICLSAFCFSFIPQYSDERFFMTKTTTVKPRYVISDARIYFNICILKEPVFQRIHSKLANGSEIQLNFLNKVNKSRLIK